MANILNKKNLGIPIVPLKKVLEKQNMTKVLSPRSLTELLSAFSLEPEETRFLRWITQSKIIRNTGYSQSRPVWAAAARGQVVSLLLGVRGVQGGGRAGEALPDHVYLHQQHQETLYMMKYSRQWLERWPERLFLVREFLKRAAFLPGIKLGNDGNICERNPY